MAGTNKTQDTKPTLQNMAKPGVILVHPQMGENIGAAARAMLNNELTDLCLVNPRDGWPNDKATAMSSGALNQMPPVNVFENVSEAVATYHHVYATTARPRDMVKPVMTAREAAIDMVKRLQSGHKIGLLFGAERTGLSNDDVALSHSIIQIPLNPNFSSLNLGQAVLLVAHEWYQQALLVDNTVIAEPTDNLPAPHNILTDLLKRLEDELDKNHFFRSEDIRPHILRNLKNMLSRAEMTEQEVQTFHGIISALTGKKGPPRLK